MTTTIKLGQPFSREAAWAGIANAGTSLTLTGLALVATSLIRRRRRRREIDARIETDECAYERFVTDFGPADQLTDQQLAALAGYTSGHADRWVPSVVAELLRGRPWNWRDEHDELDEEQPRVQHIAAVVDGLERHHHGSER
jgi:hypothetical protein